MAASSSYQQNIRRLVRISDNDSDFNDEVSDLIDAARADLVLIGVKASKTTDESDSLIKRAVALYVKAEFGLDNPDADKYRESYACLRRHLALSEEYRDTDEEA